MTQDKLHSFIVVLGFAPPGPSLTVDSWIAPDAAAAAALSALNVAQQSFKEIDITPLVSCLVIEETAENLRIRLRAIEETPAGEVVSLISLVPKEAQQAQQAQMSPEALAANAIQGLAGQMPQQQSSLHVEQKMCQHNMPFGVFCAACGGPACARRAT
jgi:hypothetical protein